MYFQFVVVVVFMLLLVVVVIVVVVVVSKIGTRICKSVLVNSGLWYVNCEWVIHNGELITKNSCLLYEPERKLTFSSKQKRRRPKFMTWLRETWLAPCNLHGCVVLQHINVCMGEKRIRNYAPIFWYSDNKIDLPRTLLFCVLFSRFSSRSETF